MAEKRTASLLVSPGLNALQHGFTLGAIIEAERLLESTLYEELEFFGGFLPATAYLIGIRQGVHNERARRRGEAL